MKVDEVNLKELIENETNQTFNRANKMCCPVHKEKTPSFSVDVKKNKFRCFGCGIGGDAIDFIKETKGLNYSEACRYLGVEVNEEYKVIVEEEEKIRDFIKWQLSLEDYQGWNLVKIYRFEDEENKTLYFTGKFSTPGKKEIRYYHINEEGKVKFGRGDKEPVPYNYARLKSAIEKNRPVFIVEGEKDADTIAHLGYVATSLKGIKTIDASIFQDAIVNFIGDTGQAGEEYKKHIYYSIADKVQSFRIIELPGLEKLGDNADVTDWLKDGHTKEEFKAAIKDFWDWKISTKWKYVTTDSKGNIKPLLVWENLEVLLNRKGISCRYNELSKSVEFENIISSDLGSNANLEDLYSLCHREHFKISKENLASAINRIAKKNSFNPVQEYLNICLENYDKSGMYIKMLCDTINTPITFDDKVKELYITKWLLNVVNIAFNKGQYGSEGILVIQGAQGLGKTRWIKSIIPNEKWVKTGLEIDPSDKDKVYQATKYWVTELGELDATLKKDQAKLKAFFTESMDEYRKPYERFTEAYPRLTAFYATVNKEEFLKDETGNRRYWVIPATNILVDHEIDLDQLWGEVMYLLKVKKYPHWLTNDNKELLKITNEAFEVKDETYLRIQDGFQWSVDRDFWDEYTSTELCDLLNIKNFTSLKTTLEKFGVKQKRTSNRRYYLLPPVNSHVSIRNENKRWGA